jgi:hypothetical protein
MLQEFDKEMVNEVRIKELLEPCKKEHPEFNPYWIWLCCVDFHVREDTNSFGGGGAICRNFALSTCVT